jgi:hypothetical protein
MYTPGMRRRILRLALRVATVALDALRSRHRRSDAPSPPPTSSLRAVVGGDCYRSAAVSREWLWELVESPVTDASTRTAAAEALAHTLDVAGRERMRTAASHCADPRVRVAIGLLAREDDAGDPHAAKLAGCDGSRRGAHL